MIKCSRRGKKSSNRKAELLDPSRGRDSKWNGDRAKAFADGVFSSRETSRALSRSSEFYGQVFREPRSRRLRRAINTGRQPHEMAPRAHNLVLRDFHFKKMGSRLPRRSSGVCLSIQLVLQRRRRDAPSRPAWADLAADR